MREILFRAKRVDDGEWVYGGYYGDSKRAWIRSVVATKYGREILQYEVDPATIGEYTGLLDKNKREICEGDIIRILYTDWPSQTDYSISFEEYKKSISLIGRVIYKPVTFRLLFSDGDTGSLYEGTHGEKEVIGTIHDNPELLEVHHG